jgi:cytochrome c oxidase subunit 3
MATLSPTLTVTEPKAGPHTGGGGPFSRPPGGDGDGSRGGSFGADDRLRRYRLGMIVALAPVAMLFVALTSAYFVRQGLGNWDSALQANVPDWRPLNLPLLLLWMNTALLAASSLTLELARRGLARTALAGRGTEAGTRPAPWLAVTVVLGLAFLLGQVAAWQQMAERGVYVATNPSSSFFYVLTGAHALHLAGGVLALLYAGLASLLQRPLETRALVVHVTAWYWHFMGLLWLYIFALLYFAR